MVNRKGSLGLLALAAAVIYVPVASQGRVVAIAAVNVTNGTVLSNRTVVINGSTISRVSENAAPPRNAVVVDGRGKFLIPGLWVDQKMNRAWS